LGESAFLLLGSNQPLIRPSKDGPQGARERVSPATILSLALQRLTALGKLIRTSPVYQSPAAGRPEHPDFLNAAVLLDTDLAPEELRRRLREIEADLGRVRSADGFAPRTIDIDICYLGNRVERHEGWGIPDPDAVRHAHAAIPLADVDPGFRHPETGDTLTVIAGRLRTTAALIRRDDIPLEPSGGRDGLP
jgi:2-amino-4-hydroxy-6-hydroxymethyldihydropteridine diphosphokinase